LTTLKYFLDRFKCKNRFADNVEAIELGDVQFDDMSYGDNVILFTNSENNEVVLRIDLDRRDIYLYTVINEKEVKVSRWLIHNQDTQKLTITVPRERVNM